MAGKAKNPKVPNANRLRFVEEYLIDRNAVQAYFRAFGRRTSTGRKRSYQGAAREARRLLQNPLIRAEVAAGLRELGRRCRTDAARWWREVALLAYADPDDLYEPDPANGGLAVPRSWADVPPAARRTVASVKVKRRRLKGAADEVYEVEELEYRTHSKTDALDKLARHFGYYRELPPLEAVLALLPEPVRERLRQELAAALLAGPSAGGDEPAPNRVHGEADPDAL